jgi:hypothetical protein
LPHFGEADGARPSRIGPFECCRALLFRFEGVTLWVASLAMSPSALCLLVGPESSRVRTSSSGEAVLTPAGIDRSPRACPGRAAVLALIPFGLFGGPGGDVRPRVRAAETLENSKASTSIFVLQATKSQRRMPWRLRPKKDVGDCEKPREAVYQASIRGYPNGATQHLS